MNLKQLTPDDLRDGHIYLCGRATLVEDIVWTIMFYSDGKLIGYENNEWIESPDYFLCSPDGIHEAYLLYELPIIIGNSQPS